MQLGINPRSSTNQSIAGVQLDWGHSEKDDLVEGAGSGVEGVELGRRRARRGVVVQERLQRGEIGQAEAEELENVTFGRAEIERPIGVVPLREDEGVSARATIEVVEASP